MEFEGQRKGRNKETQINASYINSGDYRRKFDSISTDRKLNRLLYQIAKKILRHRTGTVFEDMYGIDAETDSIVAAVVDSETESEIQYTDKVREIIQQYPSRLITIHSHPHSLPPSLNDVNCNYQYSYIIGIVEGHDGSVYMYSSSKEISPLYYELLVSSFMKDGYSEEEAFERTLQKLADQGEILYREV